MDLRIRSFRQAAFWSTAINAFSQLLSLVFSMVMAAVFGAQESTDVLYYCIGVFALLSGMFQAVNVSVLVPETMRRRHQIGELDAMAFINRFFAAFALLIAGLTVWILWNPAGTMTLISRFSAEALERNSRLVFWLLATLPLQMAAQLLLDVLVSYKFLTLPAALSCVNRILNVAFVWLFHRQLGVLSVALGMLLGFGLQVLLNLYLLRHAIRWRPLAWRTRVGGRVYRNVAWTELGTLASTLAGYLPLFLFSGFSAGAMTALNYARRLAAVPADLLTTQVSGVAAIKFNELAARREPGALAESFERTTRVLVFLLVPASVLLALVAPDVVRILLGRGAFCEGPALSLTSNLLALLALNIPLTGIAMLMARFFVAHQAIRYGTLWQIFSALLNAGLVAGGVRWLGVIGLPLALIAHLFLYLVVLSAFMARRFPGLGLWPTWRALFGVAAVAAAVAAPIWAARIHWGAAASSWTLGAATALAFAIGYGLLLIVLSPDRMAWQYCREMAKAAVVRLRGPAPATKQAARDMEPDRLTTQKYWETLYEKAAGPARRPVGAELKKWVPAPLRRLRKRLQQRHWSRLLAEVLLRPHLEGRNGLRGLEIGSAPGHRSLALWRRFGIQPFGLEYTAEGARAQRALYRANGLPEELVVQGDFFDDAWRAQQAGAFDLVASYGFIEHFERPEEVARKHLELVRPGGLLVITVPNLNPGTFYGRLVRRFNPAVYAMHNVQTCTRDSFCRIVSEGDCEILHCGPLGGCDVEFDPDGRWTSRAIARLLRLANPVVNVWNNVFIGLRLREFPRSSSVLALVARKR